VMFVDKWSRAKGMKKDMLKAAIEEGVVFG
jgi:hypothetical protein